MTTSERMGVRGAAILVAAAILSPQALGAETSWHPSWGFALSAAQRGNHLILAYVRTPGSDADKQFTTGTLTAPEVVTATQEFECVRLDARSKLPRPQAKDTIKEDEAKDATVVVLCRPKGTPLYLTFGPLEPERFLHYIGEAKTHWQLEQEAGALEQKYRGNPPTPETRYQLGHWYMLKGGADLRSILAAAFGGTGGLVGAFVGEVAKGMSLGPASPAAATGEDRPTASAPIEVQPGVAADMPGIAMGLWVGMEQDENRAKQLRAKGAALLELVRRQDPANRLGYADDIDLLLMQDAMMDKREAEADALAQRYVKENPQGGGVALAYVVQAFGSLSRLQKQQEKNAPPDFSEAKALLEKAMEGPGDDGSKMLAGMMRMIFEMMDALIKGFMDAFKGMGEAMQQGVPPK